jgi:hypothetical protein
LLWKKLFVSSKTKESLNLLFGNDQRKNQWSTVSEVLPRKKTSPSQKKNRESLLLNYRLHATEISNPKGPRSSNHATDRSPKLQHGQRMKESQKVLQRKQTLSLRRLKNLLKPHPRSKHQSWQYGTNLWPLGPREMPRSR